MSSIPVVGSNFNIDQVVVTFNGSNKSLAISPDDVVALEYQEGILDMFVKVSITLIDSTSNLLDNLFGMERWDIVFTDTFNNVTYEFTSRSDNGPLFCYDIHNKSINDTVKTVTLELCRETAIISMQKRVCKKYSNHTSDMLVADIIQKELGDRKKGIKSTQSYNKLNFIPPNARPLDILVWAKNKYYVKPSGGKFVSAGYFFFETYNNYIFEPIDNIADNKNQIVSSYSVGTTPGGFEETKRFQRVEFATNIDMMRNFDQGIYSGKIEFFDIVAGKMITKHYSLKDYYPKWNKVTKEGQLNVLESLPLQRDLTPNVSDDQQAVEFDYGSRTMFIGINNELFRYAEGENNIEDANGFINSVAQSVARTGMFTNQQLTTTATFGNMGINAGDHIEVNFFDSQGGIDKGHSGRYVVFALKHVYIEQERKFKTHFTLVRDSFGI